MKRFGSAFALLPLVVASGCFTMNATLPGALRGDVEPERVETIGSFEHEVNHWFIPCGLGAAPQTEFRKEILRQVKEKGADGVANLTFETYRGPMDCVIGSVCPIVQPRTFRVSGDLVRIKKPPLPGQRPSEAPSAGPITVESAPFEAEPFAVAY